jgi:tRNA dimethylallyltransferase
MRALEVRLLEGAPVSSMFERGRAPLSGFLPVKIGLDPPRELLYTRLNERARRMFDPDLFNQSQSKESLVDEVRRLLSAGVPPEAKPFESLGYKQVLQMLQGRITAEQALESTQLETRRYAKRQLTWFRKEQAVQWIAGFGDDLQVHTEALAILQRAGAA